MDSRCLALGWLPLALAGILVGETLHAQLSGNYTVGSGGDFETITEAVRNLNVKGVDGPTRFLISDGRYEEQVRISNVPGAGGRNRIVFESKSGSPRDVTLFFQHTGSQGVGDHVIRVDTTDNVVFRNLSIQNPGEIYGSGIRAHGSDGIRCENLNVEMTVKPEDRTVIGFQQFGLLFFDCNSISISNCRIVGGDFGVRIFGRSDSTPARMIEIEDSEFRNGYAGVGGSACAVENASVFAFERNSVSMNDGTAVSLDHCHDSVRILANRVHMKPERFATGLSLTDVHGHTVPTTVANNLVTITGGDTLTACSGMFASATTRADFYYNTFHVANDNTDRFQSTGNVAASFSFNCDSISIANNIFANFRDREALYLPAANSTFESDHNSIYTTGDRLGGHAGSSAPSLDSLQRLTGTDANSLSESPCYLNLTSFETNSPILDGAGTSIRGIDTDIDGNPRDETSPDIGAFEYTHRSSGMSGTYTIGPGEDFESLAAAFEDLYQLCVSDDVEFSVVPGEYDTYLTIGSLPGSATDKTVTVRSSTRNAEDVVLSKLFSFIKGEDYVLRLKNTHHLRLRDLTFTPDDSIYSGTTLRLVGDIYDVRIADNHFDGTLLDNGTDIFASNTDRPFPIERLDSLVIENNEFTNTERAINLSRCFGFGCDTVEPARNTRIVGNRFHRSDTLRPLSTQIILSYHDAPLIADNEMITPGNGISLSQALTNYRIVRNRFDLITPDDDFGSSVTASAISIGLTVPAEPHGLIANNMIRLSDPPRQDTLDAQLHGIGIGQGKNVYVLYNTVLIVDAALVSAALTIPFGSDSITALNNVLVNDGGGPTTVIKFIERFNNSFDVDYNILFTTGDTLAVWNDTGRTDIAQIHPILGGSETNSIVARPTFLSDTDLHLNRSTVGIGAGIGVPDIVTDDIDGEIRDEETPDVGADEVNLTTVPGQLFEDGTDVAVVRLHPNPASSIIVCNVPSEDVRVTEFRIIDVNGNERSEATSGRDSENSFKTWTVDVSVLESGLYWLQFSTTEGDSGSRPFIVSR